MFNASLRGYIVRSCTQKFKLTLNQTKQKDKDNPTNPQHDLLFCSFREENYEVGHHLHSFEDFRIEVSALPCFSDEGDLASLPVFSIFKASSGTPDNFFFLL